ncbi:MAG: ATP-binding cassette domain-containing protein, partial [Candidatus Woesearchaeota archaeon]
ITSWVDEKKVPLSRFIGFSPQSNSLYPFLTVEENIYTFGRLYSVKHHIIKERMKKLLSELRLDKNEKKKIIQLSGGMQKRADLAVTLIHDPKIIFLDEPFAGLDISLRKFLWNFLKSQAKEGKIIVISSHAIGELEKNCTQFGLITNNRFYNTEQIKTTMRTEKQRDLTTYLTGLFSHSERI